MLRSRRVDADQPDGVARAPSAIGKHLHGVAIDHRGDASVDDLSLLRARRRRSRLRAAIPGLQARAGKRFAIDAVAIGVPRIAGPLRFGLVVVVRASCRLGRRSEGGRATPSDEPVGERRRYVCFEPRPRVADHQAEGQRAADTRDGVGDRVYCEMLRCPCLKPGDGDSHATHAPTRSAHSSAGRRRRRDAPAAASRCSTAKTTVP